MNPNLEKANIYELRNVPTSKLQKVTKLRTITHPLAIETGRYGRNPKPIEERLCHCGEIETEEHFILKCQYYEHIRRRYNVDGGSIISEVLERDCVGALVSDLFHTRSLYI